MLGLPGDEESSSPKTKTGSARTSKKPRKKNIRYVDWSAEHEIVVSTPTVQQQAQDVEYGNVSNPESAGEESVPVTSDTSSEPPTSLGHQVIDTSVDESTIPPRLDSPHDSQCEDASPADLLLPTTSEQTEEHYEFQQSKEEQKADDSPSENLRPNAQNLRYGGYPAQPAPQHRNTPLGSGRLQNASKLGALTSSHITLYNETLTFLRLSGNGTNWGFGAPTNGAPGLPSVQPTQTGAGASSFAQRVGGSQPAAPLDLS